MSSIDKYIKSMDNDGAYFSHPTILSLALELNISIQIFEVNRDGLFVSYTHNPGGWDSIVIFYSSARHHFDSIYSVNTI